MSKIFVFILIGVTLVMSFVFGTYVVLGKFRPDLELLRMASAMSRTQSVEQKTGMTWSDGNGELATLLASGTILWKPSGAVEHDTKFRVIRLIGGQSYTDLSGEIRASESGTFLTYDPPGPSVTGVSFSEPNTWVLFGPGEFAAWGSVFPRMDIPLLREGGSSWTLDALQRFRVVVAKADALVPTSKARKETINRVKTRMFDVAFDPDALRSFLLDVSRARTGEEPSNEDRLAIEADVRAWASLNYTVWIGEKDHRLYRVRAEGKLASFLSDFSNYDRPFVVSAPDRSLAFDQIYSRTLGKLPETKVLRTGAVASQFLSSVSVSLPTFNITTADVDGDGLDALLETFYGTDQRNSDTDRDGVSDGDEVRAGRNPTGRGPLFGFGLR